MAATENGNTVCFSEDASPWILLDETSEILEAPLSSWISLCAPGGHLFHPVNIKAHFVVPSVVGDSQQDSER